MAITPKLIDKNRIRSDIVSLSDSTIWRLTKRDSDPFPPGFMIGGKRFWETKEVIDWLARQKMKAA